MFSFCFALVEKKTCNFLLDDHTYCNIAGCRSTSNNYYNVCRYVLCRCASSCATALDSATP